MNIDDLSLFIRIAATKNISIAGKELGLSPAVASAHMNKLEESLGVKLLHRTTRKVSLSEEGLLFLPHAEEVLFSLESAKAAVGVGKINPQGTLRIAASASFGRMHMIKALQAYLKLYPNLKIDLRLSDSIMDMVEGGFDISIRVTALADSSFIARKLAPDNRIIIASKEYLKQHGEPKHPLELKKHACIKLTGIDNWAFKSKDGLINVNQAGQLNIDNGEAVRDACLANMGISLLSTWCIHDKLKSGELVQILKNYPVVSDTAIWAVYPSSRLLAPKVRTFIDFFKSFYGENPYWDKGIS